MKKITLAQAAEKVSRDLTATLHVAGEPTQKIQSAMLMIYQDRITDPTWGGRLNGPDKKGVIKGLVDRIKKKPGFGEHVLSPKNKPFMPKEMIDEAERIQKQKQDIHDKFHNESSAKTAALDPKDAKLVSQHLQRAEQLLKELDAGAKALHVAESKMNEAVDDIYNAWRPYVQTSNKFNSVPLISDEIYGGVGFFSEFMNAIENKKKDVYKPLGDLGVAMGRLHFEVSQEILKLKRIEK